MPKNPELSSGNPGESKEASNEAINKERGNKVNNIEVLLRRREELLKRQEYLEGIIRQLDSEVKSPVSTSEPTKAEASASNVTSVAGEAEPTTAKDESSEEDKTPKSETAPTPSNLGEKIKKKSGLRNLITGIAAGLAVTIFAGGFMASYNKNAKAAALAGGGAVPKVESEVANENSVENTQYAGETINGVKYDYTEYADRKNKVSYNAYGYDYSDQYDNREAATNGIMRMAGEEPEALASYAYNIFTDAEKEELDIKGLSMVDIDDKFNSAGGGELQKKLLAKLDQVLRDDQTSFKFYHENGTEETNYVYFVDSNKDGNYTPDELHLGYDTKKRSNAPQVDISRIIKNSDGTTKTQKMLDLNMKCGYQPNYQKAPIGVPPIPADKPVAQVIKGGGAAQVIKGGGPNTPTPTPKPEPKPEPKPDPKPEKHIPKNVEAEKQNAGDYVTPLPIDNKVTPPTTEAEDRKNFDAIAEQQRQQQAAAEQAARVAAEQAAAEQAAAAEAAARAKADEEAAQAQAANEAAAKAAEEAARAQEEANRQEAEQRAQEEAAQQAQAEADAQAEQNNQEAESHNDDNASERAADFNSGDF